MRTFNSLEEMNPYFNEKTKTYEFVENGELLDIEITFDLTIDESILASNIDARNINAGDIDACDINAYDINAWSIDASAISFHAVCFAYKNIVCKSINGRRKNSRCFALDGEVIIKEDGVEIGQTI